MRADLFGPILDLGHCCVEVGPSNGESCRLAPAETRPSGTPSADNPVGDPAAVTAQRMIRMKFRGLPATVLGEQGVEFDPNRF